MDDHLGGYVPKDALHIFGDDWTYLPGLWKFLVEQYAPKRLIDLGCGEGHSTKWFLNNGINAIGIDGSKEAQEHAVIPYTKFILHDFVKPMDNIPSCDLLWCSEFVEHVEEKYMRNFLVVMAKAEVVAMTHAFPGQGGHHHVNCQLPEYWIAKLAEIGFICDWDATKRSRLLAPTSHWARSGLIFHKRGV